MPIIVALLVAALALLCLGDLVEAAAPSTDGAPCASRLCDEQTGCGTAPAKSAVLLPTAALVAPGAPVPPAPTASAVGAVAQPVLHDRQVTPLAPRSPPVA